MNNLHCYSIITKKQEKHTYIVHSRQYCTLHANTFLKLALFFDNDKRQPKIYISIQNTHIKIAATSFYFNLAYLKFERNKLR